MSDETPETVDWRHWRDHWLLHRFLDWSNKRHKSELLIPWARMLEFVPESTSLADLCDQLEMDEQPVLDRLATLSPDEVRFFWSEQIADAGGVHEWTADDESEYQQARDQFEESDRFRGVVKPS